MSTIDQQFVEFIVKSLVSDPDGVKIERRIDEKGVLLELTVSGDDLGRVIGKRGATAQSLRTLLRALGTKNDARYNLKIVDTGEDGERLVPSEPAAAASNDNSQATSTTDPVIDDVVADEPVASDSLSKTRRELAELDDLDI